MKVNDPNLSSLGSAGTARSQQTQGPAPARGNANPPTSSSSSSAPSSGDDVHLSELVRSLRALTAESPEHQAKIEQLARSYASGTYAVDPQATAGAIINDAIKK